MNYLVKHLVLTKSFWRIAWFNFSEFKIDMLLRLSAFILQVFFQIFFWYLILQRIKILPGWDLYSLAVLATFGRFSGAIFWGFFGSMLYFDEFVKDGALVGFLTRPASTFFLVLAKNWRILAIVDLVTGVLMMILTSLYFQQSINILGFLQLNSCSK